MHSIAHALQPESYLLYVYRYVEEVQDIPHDSGSVDQSLQARDTSTAM